MACYQNPLGIFPNFFSLTKLTVREGGRAVRVCTNRKGERGLQLEIMQEPACPLAECILTELAADEVVSI